MRKKKTTKSPEFYETPFNWRVAAREHTIERAKSCRACDLQCALLLPSQSVEERGTGRVRQERFEPWISANLVPRWIETQFTVAGPLRKFCNIRQFPKGLIDVAGPGMDLRQHEAIGRAVNGIV